MSRFKKLSHTIWYCHYHIVWTPKYRHRILDSEVKHEVENCIRAFSRHKKCEVVELSIQIDHIHLIVGVPPKIWASAYVGYGPTYISFDIDSLDPGFVPGIGTLEIGGLTTLEAQLLIRGYRGLHIVSADLVEASPPFGATGNTALAAANLLFELSCIASESRHQRN